MTWEYLAHKNIGGLPVQEKRYDVTDIEFPGFGIRIYPRGTKSWFMRHRKDGRTRQYGLGRYPEVDYYGALGRYILNKEALDRGFQPYTKMQADIRVFLSAVEMHELKKGDYPKLLVNGAIPSVFAYQYRVSMEAIVTLLEKGFFEGFRDKKTGWFKIKLADSPNRHHIREIL